MHSQIPFSSFEKPAFTFVGNLGPVKSTAFLRSLTFFGNPWMFLNWTRVSVSCDKIHLSPNAFALFNDVVGWVQR
jgi:hypothetical protein